VVLALALAATSDAGAGEKEALQHFERGQTHYNLGRFDEAIAEFERAYEMKPDPIFLFNIAQAHRLARHTERAIFFYRRYLALDPRAKSRAEIEEHLAALEAELAASSTSQPASQPAPPPAPAPAPAPRAIVGFFLELGWTVPRLTDTRFAPELGGRAGAAASVVQRGRVSFDGGVEITLSRLGYETTAGDSKASTLLGLYGVAAARWHVLGALDLRADLGAGVVLWGGLEEGNPFTEGGREPTSNLTAFALRLSLGLDYRLRDVVLLRATPIAIMGGNRPKPVRDQIDRFLFLEGIYFGVGVLL
jgi:tetratricopeptide (TPR) repeat protein